MNEQMNSSGAEQAHVPSPEPGSGAARRPGPRTGPIVWGALVLAFCGYIVQRVFGTGEPDAGWWIAATTIGLGGILLAVGIAVVLRGSRTNRR